MKTERKNKISHSLGAGLLVAFLAVNFFSIGFANPKLLTTPNLQQIQSISPAVTPKDNHRQTIKHHHFGKVAPFNKRSASALKSMSILSLLLVQNRFNNK